METDNPVVAGRGKVYLDETTQTEDQLPELIYKGSIKTMLWLLGKLDRMSQCFLRNGPACGTIYTLTSEIVSAQKTDRVIQDLIGRAQMDRESAHPIYELEGVLFYADPAEEDPGLRLWVPNRVIQKAVQILHGEKHLPRQILYNYAKGLLY